MLAYVTVESLRCNIFTKWNRFDHLLKFNVENVAHFSIINDEVRNKKTTTT